MDLCDIPSNEEFIIVSITHPDKDMNQRLVDLGFYESTIIKKILVSPKGDPMAYRVRGTTIALRNNDARYIEVKGNRDD